VAQEKEKIGSQDGGGPAGGRELLLGEVPYHRGALLYFRGAKESGRCVLPGFWVKRQGRREGVENGN